MTLNISKFISNAIKTQMLIHHLEVFTKTCKADKLPDSVKKLIADQYGKKYILDADYVSFFWGSIDKDGIKRLFNVVDKALGKSANRLTESDFKRLKIDDSEDAEPLANDEQPAEDIDIDIADEGDDDAIDIEVDDEEESSEDSQINESDDEESDEDIGDEESDEESDEDIDDEESDEDIDDEESDEESDEDMDDEELDAPAPELHLFLKITMNS